jgi:hypothetical protein
MSSVMSLMLPEKKPTEPPLAKMACSTMVSKMCASGRYDR